MNEANRIATLERLNGAPTANGTTHPKPAAAKRGKSPRWWGVLCGFVGHDLKRVSPPAACVWMVLFRNSRNSIVCMSQEQIGELIGVSARYVQTLVKELIEAALVSVESKGNRRKGPSRYRLLTTGTVVPIDNSTTGTVVPTATGTVVPTLQERTGATADAGASRSLKTTNDEPGANRG